MPAQLAARAGPRGDTPARPARLCPGGAGAAGGPAPRRAALAKQRLSRPGASAAGPARPLAAAPARPGRAGRRRPHAVAVRRRALGQPRRRPRPLRRDLPHHLAPRRIGQRSGRASASWSQDASVRCPIWQTDRDELSGNVHVQAQLIHTGAVLPNTDQPFPDQFWDVRVGVGYRHLFDNGWIAGANVSLGSASNKPFHSVNELTVGRERLPAHPVGRAQRLALLAELLADRRIEFPHPRRRLRVGAVRPVPHEHRPAVHGLVSADRGFDARSLVHAADDDPRPRDLPHLPAGAGLRRLRLDQRELVHRAPPGRQGPPVLLRAAAFRRRGDEPRPDLPARRLRPATSSTGFYFEGHNYNDRNFNRVDVEAAPLLSVQAQLRW